MNATLAWEFVLHWVFLPPILAAAMIAVRRLTEATLARMERSGRAFQTDLLPPVASMATRGGQ
ncbi:MAG TPA: hypothetical protein VJ798_03495 [Rhizomicrobium sp.]|nr:hypothetical protein [Rhizomicrobium sp.]